MNHEEPRAPSPLPLWLVGVLALPGGAAMGFGGVVAPFLLRRAGVPVEQIGWAVAAIVVPNVLQVFYSPLIDVGFARRTWLWLTGLVTAIGVAAAAVVPLPERLDLFLALTVATQFTGALCSNCTPGLVATLLPSSAWGRASGRLNAAILLAGAGMAWLAITLTDAGASPAAVGFAAFAAVALPLPAAFLVDEPARREGPWRASLAATFVVVWQAARGGWPALLSCSLPVGSAVLVNYVSALSPDYGASAGAVALMNGPGGAVLTALGALAGGALCDRVGTFAPRLAAGALTATCGALMFVAPLTPAAYAAGVGAYWFVAGFSNATLGAVAFDAAGPEERGASARVTLFVSSLSLPITYVGLVDSRFYEAHGARGLFGADAALNAVGVAALALLGWRWARAVGRERAAAPAPHHDSPGRPFEPAKEEATCAPS